MKTLVTVANVDASGTKAKGLGDCEVVAHEGLPQFEEGITCEDLPDDGTYSEEND